MGRLIKTRDLVGFNGISWDDDWIYKEISDGIFTIFTLGISQGRDVLNPEIYQVPGYHGFLCHHGSEIPALDEGPDETLIQTNVAFPSHV